MRLILVFVAALVCCVLAQDCPDVDGYYDYQHTISKGGGAFTSGGPNGVWKFVLNVCGPVTLTDNNNCARLRPKSAPLWGCQSFDTDGAKVLAAGDNSFNYTYANPNPGTWTVQPLQGNQLGLSFLATGGDDSMSSDQVCYKSMQVDVMCDFNGPGGLTNLTFSANGACPNAPYKFTAKALGACPARRPSSSPVPKTPPPADRTWDWVWGVVALVGALVAVGFVVAGVVVFIRRRRRRQGMRLEEDTSFSDDMVPNNAPRNRSSGGEENPAAGEPPAGGRRSPAGKAPEPRRAKAGTDNSTTRTPSKIPSKKPAKAGTPKSARAPKVEIATPAPSVPIPTITSPEQLDDEL